MRCRTISMFAFFKRCTLRRMGLCSGEASLVMSSTASWSATPGRGSHRCISDGLFVRIKSSVGPMSLLPRRSTIKSGVDEAAEMLNGIRGDEQVDLFWTKVTSKAGAVEWVNLRYLEEEKRPFDYEGLCMLYGQTTQVDKCGYQSKSAHIPSWRHKCHRPLFPETWPYQQRPLKWPKNDF